MEPILPAEERDLLLRLQAGDEGAFDAIYRRYKDAITRNLITLLKDDAVVEDTLQELFFRLWEKRATVDPGQSVAGYLYRVSANLAHDHFRRLSRDRKAMQAFWEGVGPEQEAGGADEQRALDEALYRVLDLLPPQRKRVFVLCKFQSKSYQEVATLLGISVSAVRDHVIKANKFLKSHYSHPDAQALLAIIVATQVTKGLF